MEVKAIKCPCCGRPVYSPARQVCALYVFGAGIDSIAGLLGVRPVEAEEYLRQATDACPHDRLAEI